MDPKLLADIKFNCDISDAQFWGYYSVCGLLMRYRDLFRSEKGLPPWAEIRRDEIGQWIEQKEKKWPELEQQPFRTLTINDRRCRPFDVDEINEELTREGLVYGAGYGMYLKPSFFVARLKTIRDVSGLTVYTAGTELVRDLFTAPGMLQNRTVFLRLEPLAVLLLYKHAELNARRNDILSTAFAAYGLPHRQLLDGTFTEAIEAAASRYAEVLLQHELAEAYENVPEWKGILAAAEGDRQVEHFLRAVKDLLADTSERGPYKAIIAARDRGALALTASLTDGYRKVLFPEIKPACLAAIENDEWSSVEETRRAAYARFKALRDKIVERFGAEGVSRKTFLDAIRAMAAAS